MALAQIPHLRLARDADADALFALIGACFDEYRDQGVVMDADGIDRDLHAWATALDMEGGSGFVVDGENRTLDACIGYAVDGDVAELKRFYMLAERRGSGLADRLLTFIEDQARARGALVMHAWSDSRFTRAHAFYAKHGYHKTEQTRQLFDPSDTTEWHFAKDLV